MAPRRDIGDPEQGVADAVEVLVHELARTWQRPQDSTQGALIVNVALDAGIYHQPMGLADEEITSQTLHTLLAGRLRAMVPGTRVDVDLYRETGDRIREKPTAGGLLAVEVQFALAGQQKTGQRSAKVADLGWVDDGGGDEVAAVPRRLVNEGVDGH